jgi:putative tricarboxylic transport membrane protein
MGAYALRANPADCWVALAFGVIGLGMRRTGIPAAPFLLALILGGMAETSFRRGLIVADGSLAFLADRPLALALLALAALFVAGAFWRKR